MAQRPTMRDPMNYSPPKGPLNRHTGGVGLGDNNYGNRGTQGPASTPVSTSGSVGLGGTNHGCCGTQGKH